MSQFAWTAESIGRRTWFNKQWYEYTGPHWKTWRGLTGKSSFIRTVNRHSIGTPDRHPKGTPLSYVLSD
jgi:hypothetical protein